MPRRFLLIAVIGVVLVLGGAILAGELALGPERLKGLLQPYLSQRLGREVLLERAELSLFSGVRLTSLRIMDDPRFGDKPLVSLPSLEADFTLLDLITGRIPRVALKSPEFTVVRDPEGRFNFHGIMAGLADLARTLPFRVTSASIRQGRAVLLDQASGQRIVVEQIELQSRDLSLAEPFPFSLKLKANGSSLEVVCNRQSLDRDGQIRLMLKPFDLEPVGFFLPKGLDLRPLAGRISAQAVWEGTTFDRMRAGGRVVIEDLALSSGGRTRRGLSARADLDLSYDFKALTAEIRTLDLRIGENLIKLSGRAGQEEIDLVLSLPKQPWGSIPGFFLGAGGDPPPGRISGELKAGKVRDGKVVEIKGGLVISDLGKGGTDAKPLDHRVGLEAAYLPGLDTLRLVSLQVRGPALELLARGTYESGLLNLEIPAFESDLGLLSQIAPPPQGIGLEGKAKGSMVFAGSPAEIGKASLKSDLSLSRVRLRSRDLPGPLTLAGKMRISGQDLTSLELEGRILETSFRLQGRGQGILAEPDLRLDLQADRANLTELLGPSVKRVLGLSGSREGRTRVPPEVGARGRIRVRKLKLGLLPMNNFGADYELRRSVLTFRPLDREKWRGATLNSEVSLDLGD